VSESIVFNEGFGKEFGAGSDAAKIAALNANPGLGWWLSDDLDGGTLFRNVEGAWVKAAPGALEPAGQELGYAEYAAGITGLNDHTTWTDVPSVNITFDPGDRPAHIHSLVPLASGTLAGIGVRSRVIRLSDSVDFGQSWIYSSAPNLPLPIATFGRVPAGAGEQTYKLQVSRTGTAGSGSITYLSTGMAPKLWAVQA
jgi:hypothetical protein